MANDAARFLAKTRSYGTAWQRANLVAVQKAALATKVSILGQTKAPSGGDLRLSGVGKKGGPIGVTYKAGVFSGDPTALVKATGPFHLLERDTKAGVRARKRRRGRGKSRFIGPIAGYYHPGTTGKHPFEKGVRAVEPVVAGILRRAQADSLRKTFGG